MKFELAYNKVAYLMVEVSHLLRRYECTYNECDKLLREFTNWLEQSREEKEYKTIDDLLMGVKTKHVDNDVIPVMNHVLPYA